MTTITLRNNEGTLSTTVRVKDVEYDQEGLSGRANLTESQAEAARKRLHAYRLPSVGTDINGRPVEIYY